MNNLFNSINQFQERTAIHNQLFLLKTGNLSSSSEVPAEDLFLMAIKNNKEATGRKLIHAVDINALFQDGSMNDTALAEFFLTHGARINLPNYQGKTPLMLACERGYREAVEFLIRHGALQSANKRCKRGMSALDYAVRGQYKNIIALLINAGIGRHLNLTESIGTLENPIPTLIEQIASLMDLATLRKALRQSNWTRLQGVKSPFMKQVFRRCLGRNDTAVANALPVDMVKFPLTFYTSFCTTSILLNNDRIVHLKNIDANALCERIVRSKDGLTNATCHRLTTYLNPGHGFLQISDVSHDAVYGLYARWRVYADPNPSILAKSSQHQNRQETTAFLERTESPLYPFFQTTNHTLAPTDLILIQACQVIDDSPFHQKLSFKMNYPRLTFYLDEAQGKAAWDSVHAITNMCSPTQNEPPTRFYTVMSNNCVDFVRDVFTAGGGTGEFASYFPAMQMSEFPGPATLYATSFRNHSPFQNWGLDVTPAFQFIALAIGLYNLRAIQREAQRFEEPQEEIAVMPRRWIVAGIVRDVVSGLRRRLGM